MNVLIISRCSKRAREQTCQILDQFAERTGDSAWQTAITQEGLTTLRKLLRKTARRNSAIACHWIKKSGQSELLWIVGNLRRFNALGQTPTNSTTTDILRQGSEHRWNTAETIALLAAIAGLFHDFGKAGKMFQQTLNGKSKHRFQPYRHEWLSVRLFQAFAAGQEDEQWLSRLGALSQRDEKQMLACLKQDNQTFSDSPLKTLSPLARTVAWLILSHHRLPRSLSAARLSLQYSERWSETQLNADWNALNHHHNWKDTERTAVWTFPQGTPLRSKRWCEKARQIAKRVNQAPALKNAGQPDQLFTVHMARLALMLADHYYSAQPATQAWQDESYAVYANSDRATRQLKQRLDEHNIGVAHHALLLARGLPHLRSGLPAISRHKGFRQRADVTRFHWQNKAWDVAATIRERSVGQGFFGVNMASTGCGKTFANARIMYALADEQQGCRFSIALGLRTLTLQTGQALRSRLHLDDDDLAVLTGSQAVRDLYQAAQGNPPEDDHNSRSAEDLFEHHQYVHYEGTTSNSPLHQWLNSDNRLNRLVSAPVLVATIDHLMPATEGVRGGKQIPAMLRLLTSDLVLDEPDDFDIKDLHAMCRLVNWAGMLGARVLLSSATLPPALLEALFTAYYQGRQAWQLACGEPGKPINICCAWFDEYHAQSADAADAAAFSRIHQQFAQRRALQLVAQPRLRFGRIAAVAANSASARDVVAAVATVLKQQMVTLHQQHHQTHSSGKTVSFGLVRLANINPLVAVAQQLIAHSPAEDYCIHYCVYHSQHPLAVRSQIEERLDRAFSRHDPEQIWQLPEVASAISQHPATHHIFVVLGTSVIEVGRDWDADWGIIEPSSMRSLIQFAGRIQRHRQRVPVAENMVILNSNIRALRGMSPAYCRPGFETDSQRFHSHDLRDLLSETDYQTITAIPRIAEAVPGNALAALEHRRLRAELLEIADPDAVSASHWWRSPLTWCAELQHRTPFRLSQPEVRFFLHMQEEDEEPVFKTVPETGSPKVSDMFRYFQLQTAPDMVAWINIDYQQTLLALAGEFQLEVGDACLRYGEISLRQGLEGAIDDWLWHPLLGVFRAL